jgi:excisionase family DNA binding protein
MKQDEVLGANAAARLLVISRRTVHRWCEDGTLKGFRTAKGKWRIYRWSIDAVLGAMMQPKAA